MPLVFLASLQPQRQPTRFTGQIWVKISARRSERPSHFCMLTLSHSRNVLARILCSISTGSLLRAAHGDSVLAGHPGIDRTYAAVSYAYYWPNLFADVAHFVRSCTVCAASKSSNQLRMGAESFSSISLQPFTSWAMDLIGPLPATKSGRPWIVTWVDRSSKMIVAAAAKE